MGRGKIDIKKIDNLANRQVTFSKRRKGLMKKAKELSILCDVDVGIIIFSSTDKMYDFASNGSMKSLLDQYHSAEGNERLLSPESEAQLWKMEAQSRKQQLEELKRCRRHLLGEDLSDLSFDQLNNLESILDASLKVVRAKKEVEVHQENLELQRKLSIMQQELTETHQLVYGLDQKHVPWMQVNLETPTTNAGSTSGDKDDRLSASVRLQLKPSSPGVN